MGSKEQKEIEDLLTKNKALEKKLDICGGDEEVEYMEELFKMALRMVEAKEKISIIALQKKLLIDHQRASNLLKRLEEQRQR